MTERTHACPICGASFSVSGGTVTGRIKCWRYECPGQRPDPPSAAAVRATVERGDWEATFANYGRWPYDIPDGEYVRTRRSVFRLDECKPPEREAVLPDRERSA